MATVLLPAGVTAEHAPSIEIDRQVAQNVNWFLWLRSENTKSRFDRFNLHIQTLSSLESMMSLMFLCSAPLLVDYYSRFKYCTTALDYFTCVVMYTLVIGSNIATWVIYFDSKSQIAHNNGELPESAKKRIRWLQMVLLQLWLAKDMFRMLSRVLAGPCPEGVNEPDLNARWKCNDTAQYGMIPISATISLMLLPMYFIVCVRGACYEFSLWLWLQSMGTMVFAAAYTSAHATVSAICLYGGCSLVIIMEMRRVNLFRFFAHLQLEEMLAEKARAADEANAQEMRSMIANVAHDLKTPLTSFLTGVEVIGDVVRELNALADAMDIAQSVCAKASIKLHECISSMDNCASDMRNTNAFMLMTINRCIDYTKAAKGVKLLPKLETVDLLRVLQMPFKCMTDVQRRVGLSLAPLAEDICSHVITDAQWLQENVLCLLSNAVKYSSQGTVLVRVDRVWRDAPPLVSSGDCDAESTMAIARGFSSSLRQLTSQYVGRVYCVDHELDGGKLIIPQLEMLRFEVEDHGIGLSENAMAHLFNPFKQAQRMAGGTGLGLFSLAKRIEALGGSCGVRRRRDEQEGSIFWFEIPYRPDTLASQLSDVEPTSPFNSPSISPTIRHKTVAFSQLDTGAATPGADQLGSTLLASTGTSSTALDILVVDDSPSILKMTSMLLRRHKHSVFTATNGAEAVQIVSNRLLQHGRGFDVVLMDLQMPVMDGLEATRRLRALEGVAVTKAEATRFVVIGVSANSDSETAAEAHAAGADAFITKPFSLEAFWRAYAKAHGAGAPPVRDHYPCPTPPLTIVPADGNPLCFSSM